MEQQEKLLAKLRNDLLNNLIITGPKYSGKKTLVSEITDESFSSIEGKVENIRALGKGNFLFLDVDNWSPPCFSAMLSLLEENEQRIIITCKNLLNLPDAIRTRCIIEHMEPYHNIKKYCDNIGQIQFCSDEMLQDIDKFIYKEEYDLDVYFSILCNKLIERIANGEDLSRELLVCSKYNILKNLRSLNKKQFIVCWQQDLVYKTKNYERM